MFDNINTQKSGQGGQADGNQIFNSQQNSFTPPKAKLKTENKKFSAVENSAKKVNSQTGQQPVADSQNLKKITEDIFAEVDKEAGTQVIESLNHNKQKPPSLEPKNKEEIRQAEAQIAESLGEKKINVVKIIMGAIFFVFLGIIAYGVFWFYNNSYKTQDDVIITEIEELNVDNQPTNNTKQTNQENNNQDSKEAVKNNTSISNYKQNNNSATSSSRKIPKNNINANIKPKDTDQDGLTDSEERELGTSIYKIDTDGDGLFDREEVKTYKTDPLNPDTDGDGYLDGQEVKAGYSPLGSGKLYEIK